MTRTPLALLSPPAVVPCTSSLPLAFCLKDFFWKQRESVEARRAQRDDAEQNKTKAVRVRGNGGYEWGRQRVLSGHRPGRRYHPFTDLGEGTIHAPAWTRVVVCADTPSVRIGVAYCHVY